MFVRPSASMADQTHAWMTTKELASFYNRSFEPSRKATQTKKHLKAIPMSVISTLTKTHISENDCTIVQLTCLGMFFAFWSCKYLKAQQAEEGQTQALCLRNIQFFQDRRNLPDSHPDLKFANCVSITFKQQKQEEKNNTITQQALGTPILAQYTLLQE
jgi:hypothetical protein